MHRFRDYTIILLSAAVGSLLIWIGDRAFGALVPREFLSGPFSLLEQHEILLYLFFFLLLLVYGFLVSKKRRSTEASLERHAAAIDASMDGIAIFNSRDEHVFVNRAYAFINGYDSPAEITGKPVSLAYDEEEFGRMERTVAPVLKKSGGWRGELLGRRKNGSTYFQEASITMLEDGGRICIIRDITWRKRSEERMLRSERFLNTIFHSIRDPFCIFDIDFRIVRVNEAYANLKNKRVDELVGMKCYEILEGNRDVCEGCVVAKTFDSADPCAKDKQVTLAVWTTIWVEIFTYPILDDKGAISHVIEYTRDVTERKKSEEEKRLLIEKLERLSRTDSLTGLMNRRALAEQMNHEIDRANRFGTELSLILCDMNNFKEINDRHGHATGDRALQLVSASLASLIRKTDIAGRYGGDEFMLILPGTSHKGAEHLTDKIRSDLKLIDLRSQEGEPIPLSMSIGVASVTDDAESIDSLIKRADDAMYASKQGGRGRLSSI